MQMQWNPNRILITPVIVYVHVIWVSVTLKKNSLEDLILASMEDLPNYTNLQSFKWLSIENG